MHRRFSFLLLLAIVSVLLRPVASYAFMPVSGMSMPFCGKNNPAEKGAPVSAPVVHDCESCCFGSVLGGVPHFAPLWLSAVQQEVPSADFSHPFFRLAILAPASRGPPSA